MLCLLSLRHLLDTDWTHASLGRSLNSLLNQRPMIDAGIMPMHRQVLVDRIGHELAFGEHVIAQFHSVATAASLPASTRRRICRAVAGEELVRCPLDTVIDPIRHHQVHVRIWFTFQR